MGLLVVGVWGREDGHRRLVGDRAQVAIESPDDLDQFIDQAERSVHFLSRSPWRRMIMTLTCWSAMSLALSI